MQLTDLTTAIASVQSDVTELAQIATTLDTEIKGLEAGTVPQSVLDSVTALKTGLDAIVATEQADEPAAPATS